MFPRLRYLALLFFLAVPAAAQPELGTDEELVRLSHRVVVAEVVSIQPGTHPQEPDRLQMRIVEDILGKGPSSLTVLFFGRVFDRPAPKVGTRTLAFLRRSQQGWFPVRLDGLRPAEQKERLVAVVAVRKTPELFLTSSQDALLLQALEFLKPGPKHQSKLRELLQHQNSKVRRKAASKLAKVDPRTAGNWLFANWTVDELDAFMEIHSAISSLLPRPIYVRVESTEQRRQAVELYRLAWWLASPLEREKALARLPEVEKAFKEGRQEWAMEAVALYDPVDCLPVLLNGLESLNEEHYGRALTILSESLAVPEPSIAKWLGGPEGERLRNLLFEWSVRRYEHPSLQAFVPVQARRALFLVDNYSKP